SILHAPYSINIANTKKQATLELGVRFLRSGIDRTAAIGAKQLALHPGARDGAGAETGIRRLVEGAKEALDDDRDEQNALATMAGKGTDIRRSCDELAKIIDGVTHNERLSVCLDTCHIHDAGYDVVRDFDGVLNEFDKMIGVDRIKVIHVNDSKNERGAAK